MDTNLTTPEALLLLVLDDATGKPLLDVGTLAQALGGAGLSDLVLQGRLRIADEGEPGTKAGRFVASADRADARLEPLVEHAEGHTPSDAISRIVGWGNAKAPAQVLRTTLLGELVADGALEHDETRWLGLTWSERWKRGGRTEVEDALQARARALLVGTTVAPGPDDAPVAGAIGILHAAKVLPKVFPDLDPKKLERCADALSKDSWADDAVRSAIAEVEAAMSVVMITTMAVPMMTSN